jgi:periplasmic mercuric ion binding protein
LLRCGPLAQDILIVAILGAWPGRHTVACPAILLTMRSTRFILIIGVIALSWTLFSGNLETGALDVKNMTCAVSPITVKKALEKVPGVSRSDVDFNKKTARVTFDPDKTSPTALSKATSDAGYPSTIHN